MSGKGGERCRAAGGCWNEKFGKRTGRKRANLTGPGLQDGSIREIPFKKFRGRGAKTHFPSASWNPVENTHTGRGFRDGDMGEFQRKCTKNKHARSILICPLFLLFFKPISGKTNRNSARGWAGQGKNAHVSYFRIPGNAIAGYRSKRKNHGEFCHSINNIRDHFACGPLGHGKEGDYPLFHRWPNKPAVGAALQMCNPPQGGGDIFSVPIYPLRPAGESKKRQSAGRELAKKLCQFQLRPGGKKNREEGHKNCLKTPEVPFSPGMEARKNHSWGPRKKMGLAGLGKASAIFGARKGGRGWTGPGHGGRPGNRMGFCILH